MHQDFASLEAESRIGGFVPSTKAFEYDCL